MYGCIKTSLLLEAGDLSDNEVTRETELPAINDQTAGAIEEEVCAQHKQTARLKIAPKITISTGCKPFILEWESDARQHVKHMIRGEQAELAVAELPTPSNCGAVEASLDSI